MDRYSIAFSASDLGYVRQALGRCPFDEVVRIIASIAQQCAEADRAAQGAPEVAAQPEPAAAPHAASTRSRRGRPPKTKPVAGNGAAHDADGGSL